MEMDIKIPEAISSRIEFKSKFSLWEMYHSFVYLARVLTKMIGNHKSKLVDNDFLKRLQLAVTEVNGCPACSYFHAKMALQQGMSGEEISSFKWRGSIYQTQGGKSDHVRPTFCRFKGIP
jgi:AhpD family alkylhydroperoxidase